MKIDLEPGKYIVAVSGGVDSVVLLDLLTKQSISPTVKQSNGQETKKTKGLMDSGTNGLVRLIVAHLDHGIRSDSAEDAVFVMELAAEYGLPFVGGSVRLGADASEEEARRHRYNFLRRVARNMGADGVITAHHQDDLIETAIINTLRGTGRKGLSSLGSTDDIKRPLLHVSKQEIINYARANKLAWREDTTNQDTRYLRNRVRRDLAKNLDPATRAHVLELLTKMQELNTKLDAAHGKLLSQHTDANTMQRAWFVSLPHNVALEILAHWLRTHHRTFDKKSLVRAVNHIKTGRAGTQIDLSAGSSILIGKHQISLIGPKSL